MSAYTKAVLATLAALTVSALPLASQAAFAPAFDGDGTAASISQKSASPSAGFLAHAVLQSRGDVGRDLQAPGESSFRQSSPALRNPLSASLRSDSDLFLWNLVAIVHSQQIARTFDLVETGLTAFAPSTSVVSPVPLPGALWLLVMGGAALGGARLRLGRRAADSGAEPAARLRHSPVVA